MSWINTLSLNVTEKYMPVTLEVSVVGIKCPQAFFRFPIYRKSSTVINMQLTPMALSLLESEVRCVKSQF